MRQIFAFGGSGLINTASTWYGSPFVMRGDSGIQTSATESGIRPIIPIAGTLSNLYIVLSGAPGSGNSMTATVMINGVATSHAVTVSDAATTGSDSVNINNIGPGDTVSLRITNSGVTTGTIGLKGSIQFDSQGHARNFINGQTNNLTTGSRGYMCPHNASDNWSTTASLLNDLIIPHPCTINSLYVGTVSAPGSGKSFTFSIYKNGSEEASSVIVVPDLKTNASINGLSIALAAGDKIKLSSLPSGTPTATPCYFGIGLVSDTDGNSIWGGKAFAGTNSANRYANAIRGSATTITSATEASIQGVTNGAFTLKNMYVEASVAPGTGNTWTIRSRKNTANGGLDVVLSGAAQVTNSDTANSTVFAATDLVNLIILPASTPDAANLNVSMTQFITPPSAGVKNIGGLAVASVKTVSQTAIASVESIAGVLNV